MAVYRNVNVRSPWFVQYSTNEETAYCDLRVWTGDVVANRPGQPTYTLEKEANTGFVTFELAELMRDYCTQTGILSSGTCWAEVILRDDDSANLNDEETYLVSEGYRLYTEGLQHQGNSYESDFVALPKNLEVTNNEYTIMMSEQTSVYIPVYVQPQNSTDWRWRKIIGTTPSAWNIFAESTDNDEMFRYIQVPVATDKIEFDFNGTAAGVTIKKFDCNKYNNYDSMLYARPVVLTYVNKFGAKSEFTFSMKRMEKIRVSTDKFKRNVTDYAGLTSGTNLHAARKRVTGTKQEFVLNTDYISEDLVAQLEELLLSEYVWMRTDNIYNGGRFSVNITDEMIDKKNHLNDSLIQYTLKLETSSEYINTVR